MSKKNIEKELNTKIEKDVEELVKKYIIDDKHHHYDYHMTYDENNRLISIYSDREKLEKEYDENGNVIKLTSYRDGNIVRKEEWKYDKNNNEIYHAFDNVNISKEYDENNKIIEFENSESYKKTFVYDEKTNLLISWTDSAGNKVEYTYDKQGNEINKKIYSNNKLLQEIVTQYLNEGTDRVIISTDKYGYERFIKFDSRNNKLIDKVINGDEEAWLYDDLNRVICYRHVSPSYAEEGAKNLDDYAHMEIISYDDNSNIIYKKSNDAEWTYSYDENNRLVSGNMINSDCKPMADVYIKCEYDEKGNLIHYKDNHCEHIYCYDEKGNLIFKREYEVDKNFEEYLLGETHLPKVFTELGIK